MERRLQRKVENLGGVGKQSPSSQFSAALSAESLSADGVRLSADCVNLSATLTDFSTDCADLSAEMLTADLIILVGNIVLLEKTMFSEKSRKSNLIKLIN